MTRRHDATLRVSRRAFLTLGGGALGIMASWRRATAHDIVASWHRATPQDSLPEAGPSGKLWDPTRAGPSVEPVTARDNDAAIQAIEKRLKCTCGCNLDVYTCRTTDFTCSVSPKMHRRVMELAAGGQSAEQIVAAFVRENGLTILMAPPKRGFNLAGYFVPGLAILAVGAVLVVAMRRWVRGATPAASAASLDADAPPPGTAAELERLRRELQRIEL